MTVASQVKQSLATMKSMNASFQSLALISTDQAAKRQYHEVMIMTEEIMKDLKARVEELERQEPQYKGF